MRARDLGIDVVPVTSVHRLSSGDKTYEDFIPALDIRDGTDFTIYRECEAGDLVVTDDTGPASLLPTKGGEGARFSEPRDGGTMEAKPAARDLSRRLRRSGKRTKGSGPFQSKIAVLSVKNSAGFFEI